MVDLQIFMAQANKSIELYQKQFFMQKVEINYLLHGGGASKRAFIFNTDVSNAIDKLVTSGKIVKLIISPLQD